MNQMTNVKLEQFPYSDAVKKTLARKPALFIDGEWVESTGGETLPVIDPSSGKEVSRFVHDQVARWRGSISAEHGIGQLKRDELRRLGDPVALGVMARVKGALDPLGIMNPGKLL